MQWPTPSISHNNRRLSKCNFLTGSGWHEKYVTSRKFIPPPALFLACDVFGCGVAHTSIATDSFELILQLVPMRIWTCATFCTIRPSATVESLNVFTVAPAFHPDWTAKPLFASIIEDTNPDGGIHFLMESSLARVWANLEVCEDSRG